MILLQRHRGDGNIERCLATAKVVWQIILLQQHHNCGNNISFLATNKSVWRIILLPCHNNHGNNVYSLAINKIVRQMVYLPWHDVPGKNTLGNIIIAWQQNYIARLYRPLHLPLLATKMSVASACIATLVNVAITSYCHAWQQIVVVARKAISCNAKLVMVASSFCNVTICNHWQRTWFGGNN
jgi:hypothetical protein